MGIDKRKIKKGSLVPCTYCGEPFYKMQSKIRKYNFYNNEHRIAYLKSPQNTSMSKGWHHTKEAKARITQANLDKNYNLILTDESRKKMADTARNKVWTDESKEKLRQANLGKVTPEEVRLKIKAHAKYGKDNIMYKDEDASYQAKHMWIYRRRGKPTICVDCGVTSKEKIIQWSNKDHTYQRNEDDYQARCVSCHRKYDIVHNNYKVFNKNTKGSK